MSRSPFAPPPATAPAIGDEARRPDRGRSAVLCHAYLAAGLLGILVYFLLDTGRQLVFYDAFGLSAVAGIVVGGRLHGPRARLPWITVGAALSCLIAGDLILNNYVDLFGADPPFPNVADIFFLAGNLGTVLALGIMIRLRAAKGDVGSFIDAAIIATAGGVLSWIFLMAPNAEASGLTALQRLVSVAYPAIDVLMLAVLARMIFAGGLRTPAFWLIACALSASLIADRVFAELTLRGDTPLRGHPVDAAYLLWYVFWGAAALHPSMRTITETGPRRPLAVTGRRLTLLTGVALIVPTAGLLQAVDRGAVDAAVIAVGSAVLFLLVLWRMRGLVTAVESARHGLERAVARERILRMTAADLVAATGRDDICAAAIAAVRELGGRDAAVRIAIGGERMTIVAASGDGDGDATASGGDFAAGALGPLIADQVVVSTRRASPELWRAVSLHGDRPARIMPLVIQAEIRGALIVADGPVGSSAEADWLPTLASQVSLALESAALAEDLHQRKSEERFQSLVRNASDIILIVDAGGGVRYASPSVERILGFHVDDLVGANNLEFVHPDDAALVRGFHREVVAVAGSTRAEEFRVRHRDGGWHHFEAIETNLLDDDTVRGVVINIRDITERKQAEERLAYQAFHDPLTDLPNRLLFMDRLQTSLARSVRRDESAGVLFLDVDRFKVVNDSLGHEAGDRLLQGVAQRLRATLRSGDTAARLGGDEFTVLLEDVHDADEAVAVAGRVAGELARPFTLDGREVFISASIGITLSRPGHHDGIDLLREADIAMYQAKAQGKAGFALFDTAMGAAALTRLHVETDLRRSIDRQEFEVYYQPAVDLHSGRIAMMEALVRWRHPERGLVAPAEFIPLAEETGLIVPLGQWVLDEACRQAVDWRSRWGDGAPSITVNLSARQLLHGSIVDAVAQTLETSGLPADRLTLEITETFAVEDAENNRETLIHLKALGVRLAIDDFGSGYSSLGYLRRLPVDVLKIDRGFVKALGRDPGDAAIVEAVSRLAHTRGMIVVAEGVETAELVGQVRALGCDLGQGYFFAKPLPGTLATAMIELHHHSGAAVGIPSPLATVAAD